MEERARCDMVESFAERLKRIRESKGLTKYRLAKLSGMDIAYVSQLEQGEVKHPRYDTLKSLARGLEVSVGELAGESPRTPDELLSDFESAMKAYIPVYDSCCLSEERTPIDWVAYTRIEPVVRGMEAFRYRGFTMPPEINEGDTVIVDKSLEPQPGDLVVVTGKDNSYITRYTPEITGNIHGVVVSSVHKWRSPTQQSNLKEGG